ncbi:hypothetical protein Ndes2437B_g00515 [Nannochloris sp. 'desiccata']
MPSSPSPYQGLCSCQARMPHCRATPLIGKSYEKRFESIETWQRNQTSGVERMLVARAIDELKKDPTHTNSTSENRCEEGQWGGYRG